jgi:hypothetical protein
VEVVFHLQENRGRLPFAKNEVRFKLSKPYLTALIFISSHFETIPGGWVGGWWW